jgi:putative Mg2+ transporter-C (MgtC) family protein
VDQRNVVPNSANAEDFEQGAHIRALLLQAIAQTALTLTALKSEDLEGTATMKVAAQIRGFGRQDQALEQLVVRLSLEGGVSSISWSVTAQILE